MSLTCEPIGSDDEVLHAVTRTASNDKDPYEEEELDYEEEMEDLKSNNNAKSEEDGELSDDDEQITTDTANTVICKTAIEKAKGSLEKDEGELDEDEDLEEGEVKEDDVEDDTVAAAPVEDKVDVNKDTDRNRNVHDTRNNYSRHDNGQRYGNRNYSGSHYSSQNYGNSRYNNRNDRYSNNRSRENHNIYTSQQSQPSSESAWERGLKQARELLSKASKRKEEDVDFENKRFNMTMENNTQLADQSPTSANPPANLSSRERSPTKRRRHSSNHYSSSEDEVERRHRLAYDAAPWNNQSSNNSTSGNYRSGRSSNYLSNRSAETYRDPWRRSKSPRPTAASQRQSSNRQRTDADHRYGDVYGRADKYNSGSRRSNSMSSLSSIASNASNLSSPGRKLPYQRPNRDLESSGRHDRENDSSGRTDYPKSRMDRIPKKSNALPHYQSNDRLSETKSFDSWSESLSESDSSSFYSNSDSSDDSDVDKSNKLPLSSRLKAKKLPDKRSQTSSGKARNSNNNKPSHSSRSKQVSKDSQHISKAGLSGGSGKNPRNVSESEKKPPIKMTFMKTQTSLKKDRLIGEQLNDDEPFEPLEEDMDANNSRMSHFSSGKSVNSKSQSEDEELKLNHPTTVRTHNESSNSSTSSATNKMDRREELLLKLKAVEEAIERKLNAKKE